MEIKRHVAPVVAKTLQSAFRAAAKTGETFFVVATYNGPRVVRTQPTFMSYYRVDASAVSFVAYEPWNA